MGKASLAVAAETQARLNMAMADAFVAGWATKYAVSLLRPVTYVQVVSSAAATVLGKVFGTETSFTDNTHNDRGWGPRTFKSFKAAADEAAISRMYAGIHFGFGIEGGKVQGQCVGAKILALKFKP